MKQKLFFVAVVAIFISVSALSGSAQRKYGVKKTINFKPGATSMRIVGTLRSGREVHDYYFHVRGGQKMKVDLVSNDKNISFCIMSIPDGYMMTDDVAVRSFDNDLPDTGEYHLLVETDTKLGSKYALEIILPPGE